MGTTADKLNKVLATKTDIKNAIVEKGVEVSDLDTFATYGDKIRSIKSGHELPSPYFNCIEYARRYKAEKGTFPDWDTYCSFIYPDIASTYNDYNIFPWYNGQLKALASQIESSVDLWLNTSKRNIGALTSDYFFGYKALYYAKQKDKTGILLTTKKRETNDISGVLGYWDLDNCRCLVPQFDWWNSKQYYGYGDFELVKFPKIYAPKCSVFTPSDSYADYSEGIFYMPNGNPYEIKPDILDTYNENLWGSHLWPKGKALEYTIFGSITEQMSYDLLANQFPINNSGVQGCLWLDSIYIAHMPENIKQIYISKNWTVALYN